MSIFKTKNEEIEYLGNMIAATREEDTERLKSIGVRLIELSAVCSNSIEPLTKRITQFDNITRAVCEELGITYAGVDVDSGEIVKAIKALNGGAMK